MADQDPYRQNWLFIASKVGFNLVFGLGVAGTQVIFLLQHLFCTGSSKAFCLEEKYATP